MQSKPELDSRVTDLWAEQFPEDRLRELYDLYVREWWTGARQFDDVVKMIKHSDIVIGRYSEDGALIGFARVLTDFTFKAMIFDVIVAERPKGSGIGRELIERIWTHPLLTTVESFELYCPERLVPFYNKLGFDKGEASILFRER